METVSYGLLLIAMALLIVWFYTNDRKPPSAPTTGLFAMKTEEEKKPEAKPLKGRRGPNARS